MEDKILVMVNPETNFTCHLTVSEADYVRAHEDIEFATFLLQHAISEGTEENKENASLGVVTSQEESIPSTSTDVMREQETTNRVCEQDIDFVIEKKHIWKYSETVALIKSMETHYENLSHAKKGKHVYENISNDLLSQGISSNANLCQIKWKSLLRSYSQAKDNQNKTGRGPSRFQFLNEIDAIIGQKPTTKCRHTLDSSTLVASEEIINVNKDDEGNSNTQPLESDTDANNSKKVLSLPRLEPKTENKKRKSVSKMEHEENKSRRHTERMEIEKSKLEIEEQKN